MTNLTEAKLAREAEICYATVAMITDYDCWHPQHSSVTLEEIIANLNRNTENAQNVIREAVRGHARGARLQVRKALAHAIVTDRSARFRQRRSKRLAPSSAKYLTP